MTTDRTSTKLHRRELSLDGRQFTVLSPRPSVTERFATNYFHQTWHVISDAGSARLFGEICWAMAFQRRERTLTVIDQRFLVPNPFDADPSRPIVIVNSDLGTPSPAGFDALRSRLPLSSPSEGTVKVATPGLDIALADLKGFYRREEARGFGWRAGHRRPWVNETHGLSVIAAPAHVLRLWAPYLSRLGTSWYRGTDSTELDGTDMDGEVQVLRDFKGCLSRAISTRERLFPGRASAPLTVEERERVWTDPARVRDAGRRAVTDRSQDLPPPAR